jgi:hypothetical protein
MLCDSATAGVTDFGPRRLSLERWNWTKVNLVQDLDDPPCARLDEHSVIVDDCVFVSAHAVLCGDLIVLDLLWRQNDAYPDIAIVVIGRMMLPDNILMKPGSRVDAKYTGDPAGNATDDPTYGRSDGAARRIARGGAFCCAAWNALRLRCANPERDEDGRYRHCVF